MTDKRGSVQLLEETDDHVDIAISQMALCDQQGSWLFEKDYKVDGEVWRVHKFDADPFPSSPHAHCVGGRDRFVGLKLHLGSGELFRGSETTGRFLGKKQFNRLIEAIRPKFPDIQLPLGSS